MRSPQSLEQQFLKKWIMGLQVCDSAKQNMTILERKKAIKLSGDIAMASTRNGMTCWSRALVGKALKDDYNNKLLIENMLASDYSDKSKDMKLVKKVSSSIGPMIGRKKRVTRRKKILKKIHCRARRIKNAPQMVVAKSLAKKIVKKRTQVLKSLVPGGELMDDISLMEETLDYIVSLRAQVNVMRTLANATELLNGK